MHEEVLYLLDDQPSNWPRWQPGKTLDARQTPERHLWLFLAGLSLNTISFGDVRPACFWVDGAEFVRYDEDLAGHDSEFLDHCAHCQEAELQHALASLT